MIDAVDVHLADVGAGTRRRVVVVSSARFHRLTAPTVREVRRALLEALR